MKLPPGKRKWIDRGIIARGTTRGIVYDISYHAPIVHPDTGEYLRDPASGLVKKRRRVEKVGPSRTMARKVLAIRHAEIAQGKYQLDAPGNGEPAPAFREFAEGRYLEWAKKNKVTWEREKDRIKWLVGFFGSKPLSELSSWNIERYKSSRRSSVSPRTVNIELAILRKMLNLAVDWKLLQFSPMKGVSLLRQQDRPFRILDENEEASLLAVASPHLRDIVIVALHTGLRKGELLGLAIQHVDLGSYPLLTVAQSKSGKSRTVPLNDTARAALRRQIGTRKTGHVFLYRGRPIASVNVAWYAALKRAALSGLRFHDLRHTFATRLVRARVDLVTVQQLLGHSTIHMTLRYAHASSESNRQAVFALESATVLRLAEKTGQEQSP